MPTLRCHRCGRTFTHRQARRMTRAVARQLVALFNGHRCSPAAVHTAEIPSVRLRAS